jgi:hypothetical protein
MNEKDDFVLEAILKATPYHELSNRLKKQITEDEYKNRILL